MTCKHFWRIFHSTPPGRAECEHCHASTDLCIVLDAALVAAQQDRPITITTPNPPGDKNNGRQERNA